MRLFGNRMSFLTSTHDRSPDEIFRDNLKFTALALLLILGPAFLLVWVVALIF